MNIPDKAVQAALRAYCARRCSFATPGVIGHACYGECRAEFDADETEDMRAALEAAMREMWRPMSESPKDGKILVHSRAPTNWSDNISTVFVHEDEGDKLSALRLGKYAVQWAPFPDLPPPEGEGKP